MDYNTFLAFAKSRRSVRKYLEQKVSREKIEQVVEAASCAPSNHNRQGWKFIAFDDVKEICTLAQQVRELISSSLKQAPKLVAGKTEELIHYSGAFDKAPVIILVMHKNSPAVSRQLMGSATSEHASGELISAAMASQNLLLAAESLGLGGCVMTAPLLAGSVWKLLDNLPAGFEPTCLITLGYPAETPQVPRRKKLEHIIEYR